VSRRGVRGDEDIGHRPQRRCRRAAAPRR
jgi:hypothetical protein